MRRFVRKVFFESGQATLFVLLLGLLGLTVVLATVSSSLKNLKQTTQTDFGTKALAGAESALEYGISQIDPKRSYSGTDQASGDVDLSGFPGFPAGYQGTYTISSNPKSSLEFKGMGLEDVFIMDGSKISNASVNTFYVLWDGAESAVLISALYESSSSYILDRYAFNDNTPPIPANNFTTGVSGSACGYTDYDNCTHNQSLGTGLIPRAKGNYKLKSLRVRRLYSAGDVSIRGYKSGPGEGNVDLGAQQVVVSGTATTTDGTTRRVQATQTTTGLPGLFDYAIYTEGSLIK